MWQKDKNTFYNTFYNKSSSKTINFIKLDVDKSSDIAREYGVMSIPTVILFKNGKEVKRNTGFMSKEVFLDFLEK